MNLIKCFCASLLIVTGVLVSTNVSAARCSGTYSDVTTASDSIDMGDGHALVLFTSRSTAASDNSPYTGTGMCGGYALTTPDGKTRVTYACVRKAANGDSWSDFGGMEPGSDVGTWTVGGGTGVFAANASSSGTFRSVAADDITTTGVWSGNCN